MSHWCGEHDCPQMLCAEFKHESDPRPRADHGISPAQLREAIIVLRDRLDAALKRIEELERVNRALVDRVNQLVEFHGIRPIGGAPLPPIIEELERS